jgi:hypothetical protein
MEKGEGDHDGKEKKSSLERVFVKQVKLMLVKQRHDERTERGKKARHRPTPLSLPNPPLSTVFSIVYPLNLPTLPYLLNNTFSTAFALSPQMSCFPFSASLSPPDSCCCR